MSSQFSPSTTRTDNSRSSSPSLDIPLSSSHHHPEDDCPDPESPSIPKSSVIASPPLDTRPYSPHGVGIGILSPQPVLGPFAPISRASFSPLHVRSSPSEQRSNPLDSVLPARSSTTPFDPPPLRASGSRSPEFPQPSPLPPPSLRYIEDAPTKDGNTGEHLPLTTFASAGTGQTSLRISIPPPNPTASTSTPSPPLFVHAPQDPVASSISSTLDPGQLGPVDIPVLGSTLDLLAPQSDLNIDFTEFDTEGCNALEKVYLFSRSRASFHRVFIAHALPKYLLGAEVPATELPSREIIDQITPSEAIEYVLPTLNSLAMDEDESVKEALAAELVPIIWWFVTHCRLVEDDAPQPPSPPPPSSHSPSRSPSSEPQSALAELSTLLLDGQSDGKDSSEPSSVSASSEDQDSSPSVVSVQAFTPILGTLLLSPNGIVGGSARYAVVELLRRLRRADQRDGILDSSGEPAESLQAQDRLRSSSPTPSQVEYQESESTLDIGLFQPDERRLFERELVYQVVIGMGRLDMEDDRPELLQNWSGDDQSGSGVSTAVPTPQLDGQAPEGDSYFPVLGLSVPPASTLSATIPPVTAAEQTAAMPPVIPSHSPPVSSASSMTGSPGHSSASTPSLTSSTSSSSGEYPDNAEFSDRLDLQLSGALPVSEDQQVPMDVDEVESEPKMFAPQSWLPTGPVSLPRQAVLPTTPPFEVPPPVNAPISVNADNGLSITGLPVLQVQPPSNSPAPEPAPRQISGWLSPRSAARELAGLEEQQLDDGSDLSEQAAVGRLSSMSLMAAVTASGSIGEETKKAFVTEVERVGRDSVYWVRREASFAVGALAKVVPVEVVTSSLLPLFQSLCHDTSWHVRHSVLFALPAILSRLTPEYRRQLALEVILPLSQDEETTVRSAVLEALGEVMFTFVDDEGGPPEPLLKLFLGIRETDDPGGRQAAPQSRVPETQSPVPRSAPSISTPSSAWSDYGTDGGGSPDIYDDPQRPLVCAFNYPAVAVTLGRDRWPQLRPLYLTLVKDPSFKIRRTLAASLGEIAKIIGEDHARDDLMDVFRATLYAEEGEVRMKLIEAILTFVHALGKAERAVVAESLQDAFSSGKLSTWRERESATKVLGDLVEVDGIDGEVLRRMLLQALDDRVAAVREAAVAVLPTFVKAWKSLPSQLEALRMEIRAFAGSPSFRKRTTYVTCKQEMFVSDQGEVTVRSGTFWEILTAMVKDPIVDVRIRVARLLSLISDKFGRADDEVASRTVALARVLAQDASHEVVAFAMALLAGARSAGIDQGRPPPPTLAFPHRVGKSAATFSRPPPPSPS